MLRGEAWRCQASLFLQTTFFYGLLPSSICIYGLPIRPRVWLPTVVTVPLTVKLVFRSPGV